MSFEWPNPQDVHAWLHEPYARAYADGALRSAYLQEEPFPHGYFPHLFRRDIFEAIRDYCSQLNPGTYYTTQEPETKKTNAFYAPIECEPLVRFLYGKSFRSFLTQLSGGVPVYRTGNGYPQLRKIPQGSYGFDVHTDEDSGLDLAFFINLNHEWTSDLGGELCLWELINDEGERAFYRKVKELAPVANSGSLLYFSPQSHHSVAPMKTQWNRANIITEWNLSPQSHRQ